MRDPLPQRYPTLGGRPTLLHGADYNPDQWLDRPEVLAEDARLMRLAGVNTATLAVFAWTALEPEEGRYCFDWLDETFERLHRDGVRVVLATPSGARPAWLDRRYPEAMRTDARRVKALHGVRENHCPTSPAFRRLVAAMNEQLAGRYGRHPALILWHVSNELSGECHCPLCQEAFRAWLRRRYGSLQALNGAWWTSFWSHTFTAWEELESPSPLGEFLIHGLNLDWRRFVTDQTADFVRHECEALRRLSPGVPVTVNMMEAYDGLDYARLAADVDVVSWDSYPAWHNDRESEAESGMLTAFSHDYFRSLRGGQPFLLMESTPSNVNWQRVCKLKRPGMHRLQSVQAVAHGSDSVLLFQWRKSRGASEKFHGAVIDHEGSEGTRVFREVAEVGALLPRLEGVAGTTVRPRVAVVFDTENRWAIDDLWGLRRDRRDYLPTVVAHYRELWRRGVPVDVVSEGADLGRYALVIAPMLYMVRAGVGERLTRFVREGGCLVSTYLTGYVDDSDLCFQGGFPGPLRECLGIWAEEIDALYDGDANALVCDPRSSLGLSGTYPVRDYCELVHAEGAEVLASYGADFYAGRPALTRNRLGKGEAFHVAARTGADFLSAFTDRLLAERGIASCLGASPPAGVSVQRRGDGVVDYLFVMNFGRTPATVALGELGGLELLGGRQVSGALELAPFGVAVIRTGAAPG
ncbi:MAG TPA: beta-galactosidase [Anaeromyxobacter sp.]|nr:beta-galactosidase [Anaeromyxobacter sp.]